MVVLVQIRLQLGQVRQVPALVATTQVVAVQVATVLVVEQ
jgi:hypothetical protein